MQTCTNAGCNATFDDSTNHAQACRYHPGPPLFHDRLRGWKCCEETRPTFEAMLKIPGCTVGPHCATQSDPQATPQVAPKRTDTRACYLHFEDTPDFTLKVYLAEHETLDDVLRAFTAAYNRTLGAHRTLRFVACAVCNEDGDPLAGSLPVEGNVRVGDDLFVMDVGLVPTSSSTCTAPGTAPVAAPAPPAIATPTTTTPATTTTTTTTTTAPTTDAAPEPSAEEEDKDPDVERVCLNHGCGATYRERDNSDSACRHHLAPPFFHDMSQGYACCSRVMSFEAFQRIPTCSVGRHSDTPLEQRPAVVVTNVKRKTIGWEQTREEVTLVVPVGGVSAGDVDVDIDDTSVMIEVEQEGEETRHHVFSVDPFFARVKPRVFAIECNADAIRVLLHKQRPGVWGKLEG